LSSKKRVPKVSASGSYAGMGAKVGRECASVSRSMLASARANFEERGISWDMAIENSTLYLPYAEDFDSKYIDYLRGYARGAKQRFEDLFVLICQDEKGLCTDVAVNMDATADGSVLSAHTEDWRTEDERHAVLLHGRPDDGPAFLLMTLGGLELVGGINSRGISFTGNSLSQNDTRIGIPKMVLSARIASAKTLSEAISAALAPERASSYNNNICHSSGEMYSVEASATDSSLIYPEAGCLVHTNHYLSPKMAKYEALFTDGNSGTFMPSGSSSLTRYNRARRLLNRSLGRVTMETLRSVLSDHVDFPNSICCHPQSEAGHLEQYKTIYATIADLTKLELWVCLGEPCKGKLERHSLN